MPYSGICRSMLPTSLRGRFREHHRPVGTDASSKEGWRLGCCWSQERIDWGLDMVVIQTLAQSHSF